MNEVFSLPRTIILWFIATLLPGTIGCFAQTVSSTNSDKKTISDTVFFEKAGTEVFAPNEQLPEFPGGENALKDYIIQHTTYPPKAVSDSISGKVIVRFAVQPDGSTSDFQIIQGVRKDIDQECIKVISEMPSWKPGLQLRHDIKGFYWWPVKVWYSISVLFTLDNNSAPKGILIIRPK